MNRQTLFLILLLLVFLVRFQQAWPLNEAVNPEFESITIYFDPILYKLSSSAEYLLPSPQAGLLLGMVLGVKSNMSSEFRQALRKTSTIHMVVVSGQNLTLLSGFVLSFAPFLGRKKAILLALGFIIFYAFLTGLQVPVIRAGIMVLFASIAKLIGREEDGFWILLITALGMLIFNPNWILSISFQLSFLATIGVVIVAPELIKRLNFLPNLIKQDLGVSICAQALVFPVIAANFNQASLVGLFANAFLLWTVPFIMISGAVALLMSLLSLNLAWILALFPGVFLTYFVYIVEFFNRIPGASVYVHEVSPFVWIGYYILVLGIYLWIKKVNQKEVLISSKE